jgi:hypothetical protein
MAVSRAMRRLLQVLTIQEEACRAAMELARAELKRLEQALTYNLERERGSRRLLAASAASGEIPGQTTNQITGQIPAPISDRIIDRIAAIEEAHLAKRIAAALLPRIAELETAANARQHELLGKHIERRQAETLIEEAKALRIIAAGRRAQRDLDDWFRRRGKGSL